MQLWDGFSTTRGHKSKAIECDAQQHGWKAMRISIDRGEDCSGWTPEGLLHQDAAIGIMMEGTGLLS